MTFVINQLIKTITCATAHNADVQAAPTCILWPDKERQWEAAVPRLQQRMGHLFTFGDYAPEKRTGPAIWLRCLLAGTVSIDEANPDEGIGERQSKYTVVDGIPVIYLPGVSRQELREVKSCPDHLKPLVELQFRGVTFLQTNSREWSISAFLKSKEGGLGLDVAQDRGTIRAMQLALVSFLDEEVAPLRGKRLDKDYFNTLLTDGDPVRDLLLWLDQGDDFKKTRGELKWRGLVEVCKSLFAFDPENDGRLVGAEKLACHEGAWGPIWERFCDAPKRYPHISAQIEKCSPPSDMLYWHTGGAAVSGWPQWNTSQEEELRASLLRLSDEPPHLAAGKIKDLSAHHSQRNALIWAELGMAPLAAAVKWLGELSEVTRHTLASGTVDDVVARYTSSGWRADECVLQALASISTHDDTNAVTIAIRALYYPWVEESALHIQNLVQQKGYPGTNAKHALKEKSQKGDCILFVDGLRYDVGKRLSRLFEKSDLHVEETFTWAALPSITATGKPAVSPVAHLIYGMETHAEFQPSLAETGRSLKNSGTLKKCLQDDGWTVLERSDSGDGIGMAWCEFGDIDHEGHERGSKLANHLDGLLAEIKQRVTDLFQAGWQRVRVVTDHGWLLMPGELPKIDLPVVLTENKWGRCALLKPGSLSDEALYPWHWNADQDVALASGISCYRKGVTYTHGGLSLQECLTPELIVTPASGEQTLQANLLAITWKGMRCKVTVETSCTGLLLDIRPQPGNPDSSIVTTVKPLKLDGTGSVVVEDDALEGTVAMVVLITTEGLLVTQDATVIGGGDA